MAKPPENDAVQGNKSERKGAYILYVTEAWACS